MSNYARTLAELKEKAILFWSREILEREASASILPMLLETQDKFVSVLNLADSNPAAWKTIVQASENIDGDIKGNLYLKHLMVLSDLGGEALSKLPPLSKYFSGGKMIYVWRERKYEYKFQKIQNKISLTNSALKVDGKSLVKGYKLDGRMEDVAMLLLYGAASISDTLPDEIKNKCLVGDLIGKPDELEKFVKENYIKISGQVCNQLTLKLLKQNAQNFFINTLKKYLPDWEFVQGGKLSDLNHVDSKAGMTIDVIIISPNNKHFGVVIESYIGRKIVIDVEAERSANLAKIVRAAGHYICYIDAGMGIKYIRMKHWRNTADEVILQLI